MSARHRSVLSLAFLIPLAVYWTTRSEVWALNTIYSIDGAELVIAAHTLGIDHPPGHPLYLLVAHLFTLLPFPTPDAALVSNSLFFGSLATFFLALAVYERTKDAVASLGTGLTFATGFIFWIHATIAEVYTLQLAFLSIFFYLAGRWLNNREERTLLLLVFTLALGSTSNILLLPLMAPATLLLMLVSGVFTEQSAKQRLAKMVAAATMGLIPMLYIPIRLKWGNGFISDFVDFSGFEVQSPRWYWWYLTAEAYTSTKITDTPVYQYPSHFLSYVRAHANSMSPAATVLAIAGLGCYMYRLFRELSSSVGRLRLDTSEKSPQKQRISRRQARPHRTSWAGLYVLQDKQLLFDSILFFAFLCTLLPVVSFRVPDREVFFMPSFLFLTAGFGIAIQRVGVSISKCLPASFRPAVHILICFSIPLYLVVTHYPSVIRITKNDGRYQKLLERFKKLPRDSMILARDDAMATRHKYFQIIGGLRPDITIHTLGRLAPHFRGPVDLKFEVIGDVGLAFNTADRLRVIKRLLRENPNRPLFVVSDYRMPEEFDHFRVTRSAVDPNLLHIQPKSLAETSTSPPPVDVRREEQQFEEIRFHGFEINPLDRGESQTYSSPLEEDSIDGIIKRDELFTLGYVIQRTREDSSKFFAEFVFINDELYVPSAYDFVAAKQIEIPTNGLRNGWYRKDSFVFKIPSFIPGGVYTLAVKVNKGSKETQGSYQDKPVYTLLPQPTLKPWMGQSVYRPLGRILVD